MSRLQHFKEQIDSLVRAKNDKVIDQTQLFLESTTLYEEFIKNESTTVEELEAVCLILDEAEL